MTDDVDLLHSDSLMIPLQESEKGKQSISPRKTHPPARKLRMSRITTPKIFWPG